MSTVDGKTPAVRRETRSQTSAGWFGVTFCGNFDKVIAWLALWVVSTLIACLVAEHSNAAVFGGVSSTLPPPDGDSSRPGSATKRTISLMAVQSAWLPIYVGFLGLRRYWTGSVLARLVAVRPMCSCAQDWNSRQGSPRSGSLPDHTSTHTTHGASAAAVAAPASPGQGPSQRPSARLSRTGKPSAELPGTATTNPYTSTANHVLACPETDSMQGGVSIANCHPPTASRSQNAQPAVTAGTRPRPLQSTPKRRTTDGAACI